MPRHPVILKANEVRNYDPVKAAEMVEELILKGDSTAPGGGAFDLLGQIYLTTGDLLSARDSFLKNLEVYPDSEGTFCYLGLIEDIAGSPSKAHDWYAKCTDRNFDAPYIDMVRSAFRKWQQAHPDSISRIALLSGRTKPPSLSERPMVNSKAAIEPCSQPPITKDAPSQNEQTTRPDNPQTSPPDNSSIFILVIAIVGIGIFLAVATRIPTILIAIIVVIAVTVVKQAMKT